MAETFTVTGLQELQRKLEELPRDVARRVLREPMTNAANLVKEAMVNLAPKDSGFLAEHFNAKFRIKRGELAGTAFIGPAGHVYYPGRGSKERGTSTGKNPKRGGLVPVVSIARFLEFGTSKMAAKPFMRPAFESTKGAAIDVITQGVREALAKWGGR